ncbi:MAG: nitroreductase family protein [Spirochaetia bacterium]
MNTQHSVVDTITRRFSCRTYSGEPIPEDARRDLAEAAAAMRTGPFGSRLRFLLAAASAEDGAALKSFGTYGTIRGATAFLLGAAEPRGQNLPGTSTQNRPGTSAMYLEDFGYAMEVLILRATEQGLGTCWLGGFFTRGSFSRRIGASRVERIPAVAAVGRIFDMEKARQGLMRRTAGGSRRKGWEIFFHDGEFGAALSPEAAGPYASPLEMARWAPSASNRQPVRIVRSGASWHFYIQRTPGYLPRFARTLTGIEDLQRVDSGIAMCHFELTAREQGLSGQWVVRPPSIRLPDALTEYSATWEG